VPVVDARHPVDSGDRLGVHPVGDERVALHDVAPHVGIRGRAHLVILGAGHDPGTPRAVVGVVRIEIDS